ncbi:hypothetical protein PR202_gb08889 [Eleusine coracana subsp. coracana]|uniref:RING-CH-type domain-containing protein n=1 Tax=Eleusine coracana subsp. coracana TaxID=191504 RepID=A0AAV5EFV4_ELECO|nr:hypothetical protein PR202_gb08889 [Eleusine coracana subsp. coracana]
MGDHVAVDIGELVASRATEAAGLASGKEEAEALIGMVECRICQEEDLAKNLESPCACSGSLKSYKPGYTAPPQVHHDETTIEISGGDWTISGNRLDLRDPRILAMAAAQHRLLEDEYDEYTATNNNAAAFCRSIFLILMALLLLRHTLTITNSDDEDDASAIFSLDFCCLVTSWLGLLVSCSVKDRDRKKECYYRQKWQSFFTEMEEQCNLLSRHLNLLLRLNLNQTNRIHQQQAIS